MRKKLLIPRRDHEIYFIPFKNELKKKEYPSYIQENLYHLHPGFSESSAYDTQKIILDKKPWFMVSVMVQGVLTEYRISNPYVSFFTSTCLLVRQKKFTESEAYNFPDEQIGYNKVKHEPFSLPIALGDQKASHDNNTILSLLKKAPGGYRVFPKKSPQLPLLAACTVVVMLIAFLFLYNFKRPPVINKEETASVTAAYKEMPSPLQMFAAIACVLHNDGGVILQWQYDRMQDPAFIISLEGIEPNSLPAVFDSLRYVTFDSISDIKYADNIPQYTLYLSFNESAFITPVYFNMENQEDIFPILDNFHSDLNKHHVLFLTEALPTERNGFDACSMAISCPPDELTSVMETIENILSIYQMCLTRMSLVLNKNDKLFSFSYSFSPGGRAYKPEEMFSPQKYNELLSAFGCIPKSPEKQTIIKNVRVPDSNNLSKIGLIIAEDGSNTAYYRDTVGKIIIKEE
jgi:hypothetical protein